MFVYQSPSAINGASTISMQLTGNTLDIDLSREGNIQHIIIETKYYGFTSGYDALASVKINFNVATQRFDFFL